MVRFWSLSRSGLFPVEGRGSWRLFRCAVASCGLPRPFLGVCRGSSSLAPAIRFGVEFLGRVAPSSGERLFRCWFEVRVPLRGR